MELLSTPLRRRLLFALLYLAEGAPIGFLWWALPTLLREGGAEVERVGTLLAVVGLPWTLKVFGAPFVDLLRGWGVPLRTVLLAAQLVMIGTLLAAARGGMEDLAVLQTVLVVHAAAAALQDVAIDALCITVTPPAERGRVNGWMQAGYQLGRGLFGGGMLLSVTWWGGAAPWYALAALLAVVWLAVVALVPARAGALPSGRSSAAMWSALGDALRRRSFWHALAFALVAAAGFEALGAFAGSLLHDRGWVRETIAVAYELPKVAAMALGGLLGGWCVDRWGAPRAVVVWQVAFASLALVVAGVEAGGWADRWPVVAALVAFYFPVGAFTAASYALLMAHSPARLPATVFGIYMGATNACENWSIWGASKMVAGAGYAAAFAILAIVSLLAVALVPRSQGRLGCDP